MTSDASDEREAHDTSALAAVRALLAASAELARTDASAAWRAELVRATGLTPAGVTLGLAHLETEATDAELASLVAYAGRTSVVHVILSANVFTAAARAIALARAAAPRVIVRPSSREPVFARVLVEALVDPGVTLASTIDLATITEGEVHVYGRDATIAEVRAAVRPGVRVRGHGAGMGIACVGRNDALEAAAAALVRDVVPFDQRGCLSPRVAFVLGDVRRARRFARHVHDALIAAERTTPRGALDPSEKEELTWYTETVSFGGELHEGKAHAVGVGEQLVLPPPGRHVHVMNVDDAIALKETLAPVASAIAAVGYDDPSLALALPPYARQARLGAMQRPPFDGPVDQRPDR